MAAKRRSKVSGAARATTDHDEIISWAEDKGAHPAMVRGTGIVRLDFPGFSGQDTLEPISWDEFFEKFEESKLAFLYQDRKGSGRNSTFNKLVHRETAAEYGAPSTSGRGSSRTARGKSGSRTATRKSSPKRKAATPKRATSTRSSSRSTASARGSQGGRSRGARTSRVRSAGAQSRTTAPKQVSRKSTKKRGRTAAKSRSR